MPRPKRNHLVPPDIFHDPNLRGEWVAMQFAADAALQGFIVLRPLAHFTPYDFVLEYCGSFIRVQVKATHKRTWSIFGVECRRSGRTSGHSGPRSYHPSEVDFVAAYVAEARTWYLVPIQDVLAVKSLLRLDPYNEGQVRPLEQFRDGWRLLRRRALYRRPRYRARPSVVRKGSPGAPSPPTFAAGGRRRAAPRSSV